MSNNAKNPQNKSENTFDQMASHSSAITTDDVTDLFESFDEVVEKESQSVFSRVPSSVPEPPTFLKHGGYLIVCSIWRFFTGPKRFHGVKNKDNRFKFIAEQIISTLPDKSDPVVIESTQKLLDQHRTIEDTEARRRLERWACKTIIGYLLFVFLLTILNGLSQICFPTIFVDHGFISDTVMYVLLSTTTVNIIGLGIIVLKGHFPSEDKKKKNIEQSCEEQG